MNNLTILLLAVMGMFTLSCNREIRNAEDLNAQTESTYDFQAYTPFTLPSNATLVKIEQGICTITDNTSAPASTIVAPLCGGIGGNLVEDALSIVQASNINEFDPSLVYVETYQCGNLNLESGKGGKVCLFDNYGQKKHCVNISQCGRVTLFVKADIVKMFVPKGGCPVTPY